MCLHGQILDGGETVGSLCLIPQRLGILVWPGLLSLRLDVWVFHVMKP